MFHEINIKELKKALFLITIYNVKLNKNESLSISQISKMFNKSPSHPIIRESCKDLIKREILTPKDEKFSFQRYSIDKEKLYELFIENEYKKIFQNIIDSELISRCIKKKRILY